MSEHALPPEPPTRRIHQYGLMIGFAVVVVICTVWLVWSYSTKNHEARQNAAAAQKLCRQLNTVGQPCATQAAGSREGVTGAAQMPAPTASLEGSALTPRRGSSTAPMPTDENGIPQAYQPSEDALIISVNVAAGRLILTFDDGARVDAGPVNEESLAIVLRAVSPSPSPSPVTPSASGSTPSPSETASPSQASPEESPS